MAVDLLPVWCCPLCGGALAIVRRDARVSCARCTSGYDIVAGIPDLRVSRPSWIDVDADRDEATRLDRDSRARSLESLVRQVFMGQRDSDDGRVALRTRQVLAAPAVLGRQLRGWLRDVAQSPGFVEVGCGPGMLLAAAADLGVPSIGIDVSLTWLVVARRMVETHGGRPVLAAALAEALPLPDDAAPAVVSLDVIEHVGDQRRFVREIDRIASPGAPVALSTPNRFSLAAEPHVGVWGVGWLPRRWQPTYVRLRSGQHYDYVRLLSARGFKRLLRRHTHIGGRLVVPALEQEEIARFGTRRRLLARAYNRASTSGWMRWPLLAGGPFFRFVGTKAPGANARPRAHAFTTEVALPIPTEVALPIPQEREERMPVSRPERTPPSEPAHPPLSQR